MSLIQHAPPCGKGCRSVHAARPGHSISATLRGDTRTRETAPNVPNEPPRAAAVPAPLKPRVCSTRPPKSATPEHQTARVCNPEDENESFLIACSMGRESRLPPSQKGHVCISGKHNTLFFPPHPICSSESHLADLSKDGESSRKRCSADVAA